jgi:hypothetical protein
MNEVVITVELLETVLKALHDLRQNLVELSTPAGEFEGSTSASNILVFQRSGVDLVGRRLRFLAGVPTVLQMEIEAHHRATQVQLNAQELARHTTRV